MGKRSHLHVNLLKYKTCLHKIIRHEYIQLSEYLYFDILTII